MNECIFDFTGWEELLEHDSEYEYMSHKDDSTATSDVSMESTPHCKERQAQRAVTRRQIQKVLKDGVGSPDPQGNSRRTKLELDGIVVIIQDKNTVISTWRINNVFASQNSIEEKKESKSKSMSERIRISNLYTPSLPPISESWKRWSVYEPIYPAEDKSHLLTEQEKEIAEQVKGAIQWIAPIKDPLVHEVDGETYVYSPDFSGFVHNDDPYDYSDMSGWYWAWKEGLVDNPQPPPHTPLGKQIQADRSP